MLDVTLGAMAQQLERGESLCVEDQRELVKELLCSREEAAQTNAGDTYGRVDEDTLLGWKRSAGIEGCPGIMAPVVDELLALRAALAQEPMARLERWREKAGEGFNYILQSPASATGWWGVHLFAADCRMLLIRDGSTLAGAVTAALAAWEEER